MSGWSNRGSIKRRFRNADGDVRHLILGATRRMRAKNEEDAALDLYQILRDTRALGIWLGLRGRKRSRALL